MGFLRYDLLEGVISHNTGLKAKEGNAGKYHFDILQDKCWHLLT